MSNIRNGCTHAWKRGCRSGCIPELVAEIEGLRKRVNELEELLIMLVRTGWPWDEDGDPNGIFHSCRDGYTTAIVEARELLGLDHRSRITRTEPRT